MFLGNFGHDTITVAEELNLTRSVVSHQVTKLEEILDSDFLSLDG
ncbi:helix-turn-helix domain-containing protein [Bradyrhizobium nanningense]|nr:LysR family transcriptional regulator [Bradyrhizobium nanningense]